MRQSNNKKKTRDVTAFIYLRLSRDDNLEGESYSIGNQKKLLTKAAKDLGYTNIVAFIDDGVSGVTMNRPDFNKMMEQLEEGRAAALFVKDLSRLGRNYIEVGRLMEEFFPEHDIRLVAVSDNIDTAEGENEMAPIRNLFNEWYARDISKKRRISNKIKGNAGEPMGQPPYGYMKDPDNPKRWIVDEEAALIVKRIYSMTLEGLGTEQIAAQLEREEILTPRAYWLKKGMRQVVAMGKGHVIPLDAALHCEEAVPHIHFRAALGATDKYGHFVPNQNKALEAMGFDGRNPETGQKDRYHNPLVAYTDKVREVFYQECEKLGLTIDREVTSESHRQVEMLAYKCEAARKEVAAAQEQLRQMEAERDESVRAAQRAQEALVAAQRERDTTESRIKALRGSEAALVAKNEHLSEYNTKLEERKAVVITEGQAIVAENKQLKEANEKLSQDNKQLHQEDRNLRSQVRQLQEQVNGLTMQLGQLDMEKKQLEAETTQAKADRDAAVQAAKDIQNEQRQQYLQYAKGKEAKTFGEVPEQPEKRILGKVTQEARPACILVEKDDFKRLQKAAGYHYKVDYTQTQIDELDRKISEHDIIQGLEKKVQQQQFEINRLNGENSRMHQQKQKDEWTIEQLEQALGAYGIPNPTQQQQHHHRQRF